jgi:phenylacetate-coenzyme A ligase PaaK-like adenylate-forming protein
MENNPPDLAELQREYLVGDAFMAKFSTISRDFIWQEQNERFKRLLARAWRMQFYQRLWGGHGVKPGDVRSLLDIEKLPVFDATDIHLANDFAGLDSYADGLAPLVFLAPDDPIAGAPNAQMDICGVRSQAIQTLLGARADAFQAQPSAKLARYHAKNAGLVALEGSDRAGLYLMEDTHYVEILPASNVQTMSENAGELVITTLYKTDIAPLIRFNNYDSACFLPGESALGLNLRRIRLLF